MFQPQLNRRSLLRLSAAAPAAALLPAELFFSSLLAGSPAALPADARLQALKDLNGYFPFTPSASPAEWSVRREYVIRQLKVALGLWPMPERPAIQAVVHGRVDREDYTVDRVYFESSPGLLVTGSLYLPKAPPSSPDGTRPTILCPHGHWPNGRFHDHGDGEIKNQLQSGGETDPVGGRHPLQARCVQLARMGCMVFLYDMLGYADGSSLTQQLTHGFARQRPELSRPEQWGLFSAQSELRCLNAMGLQTWNSIRALDWISSRPDCDRTRIGCTGASGGGTQTFILTALDDRVAAAFPAVMVSTAMQGGCTCENASYLRVNTGNIEFAALAAPRPIAMTGADDWTVEIETKGLPELKRHYAMLGAPDNVQAKYRKFPHNYNLPSRLMMYDFFNRTLKLGIDAIAERPYVPLTQQEATVFGEGHPAPDRSEAAEVALLRSLDAASQKQIGALAPKDGASLAEFRRVIGGALEVMIGRSLPPAGSTRFEKQDQSNSAGVTRFSGRLQLAAHTEELPCLWLLPDAWNQQAVLWIDGHGKSTLNGPDGTPIPAVASLLKAGFAVGSVDLLLTGEFTADGQPVKESPRVNNPREFAGYTYGYNHPLFAQRVHDILTLLSSTVFHERQPRKVHLVGLNGAAGHAIAAAAIAGKQLASITVDTRGFRFATITEIRDPNLLPGAVKYGDLPALLALCAPLPTAVASETDDALSLTTAAFRAASAQLRMLPKATSESLAEFVISQA
jgi:hypothetical protein